VKITTYRLGAGSIVLVGGVEQYEEPGERGQLAEGLAAVLRQLGVSVAFIPPGVELTIVTGPAHPIEIGTVSLADARRSG
jgi:hypothetical protein